MKRLIAATFGIALIAALSVFVADRVTGSSASADAADRTASPLARTAAVRIRDIDADLRRGGRLRLEVETRGATRVRFTYRGRHYAGRVVDRDDGAREWARTVRTRNGDRNGGRRVTIRVRACGGGDCSTRSARVYLERPDRDDDDDDDDDRDDD
jgi:hypothetical protein